MIFTCASGNSKGWERLTGYGEVLETRSPMWRVQSGFYQANLIQNIRETRKGRQHEVPVALTLSCVRSFPVFARSVGRALNAC